MSNSSLFYVVNAVHTNIATRIGHRYACLTFIRRHCLHTVFGKSRDRCMRRGREIPVADGRVSSIHVCRVVFASKNFFFSHARTMRIRPNHI